jgi:NACalpha-BTF3-like transcription factor
MAHHTEREQEYEDTFETPQPVANQVEPTDRAEPRSKYQESNRILKIDDPGKGPEGIAPNLQSRIVVGVFERRDEAKAAMHDLQQAGVPHDDISLVMQQAGTPPEVGAGATKANQGTVAGATGGAVLGGIVGLAALAIPGIGPLLAVGPIAAALGAMGGAALGGLVGSFSGLGIPTEQAKEYDAAVRAGGIVVATKVADRADEDRVCAILKQHHPRTVGSYTQAL